MDYRELLRVALRALRANKLRSILTLLGVIIGVSTIVGVVGVISGLDTYVKEQLSVMSPDVYVLDRFGLIRSREEYKGLERVNADQGARIRELEGNLKAEKGRKHRAIAAAFGDKVSAAE